jgi:hypothetical protein
LRIEKRLRALNLIVRFFGWVCILALATAAYFLVSALAFDGSWTGFLVAAQVSGIATLIFRVFSMGRREVAKEAAAAFDG